MVITRHVDFLAAGYERRRAPARRCKSERSVPFALAMACWRATASTSHREKDHVTRNSHVVPRRTTNKTPCALCMHLALDKSIPPLLYRYLERSRFTKRKWSLGLATARRPSAWRHAKAWVCSWAPPRARRLWSQAKLRSATFLESGRPAAKFFGPGLPPKPNAR